MSYNTSLSQFYTNIKNTRPKEAVMKMWYSLLLLKFVLFILACQVAHGENNASQGGSLVLTIASSWTAMFQIVLGGVGTAILKRLPTAFGVGFLIGLVVVAAHQNIIIFASFRSFYIPGDDTSKKAFALLALILAFAYLGFVYVITHFREFVIQRQNEIVAIESIGIGGGEDFVSPYKSFDRDESQDAKDAEDE